MIYLAPLQGITDRIYRNLFPLYFRGVDQAVAPFVSSSRKMKTGRSITAELAPDKNTGLPTIPQIMSSHPEDFTRLANVLYDMGYREVNWNLGCPYPMVVKKCRGAGLLCHPDRIDSFLEKALPDLKPKLSIKLRLGLKSPDEARELLPVFNRYALDKLIIHPRTAAQMYDGRVDLDRFEQCMNGSKHRIVYNGDIDSADTQEMLSERFPSVDDWMIGRGLLRNPFLAEEIKFRIFRPYPEKLKIIRTFHDHLYDEYSKILQGPAHMTNKMKEIWAYLGDFFENGRKIQKLIRKTHHSDQYVAVVDQVFDNMV